MFSIERTSDIQALWSNADQWNALAGGVPFRETSWLRPWWQHFGNGQEAYVLVARDDQRAIRGILPMFRPAESPQTLAMIGNGRTCSDYVSVLAAPDDGERIAHEMGNYLATTATDRYHGWSTMQIDGIVAGDQPMEALARSLQAAGATVHGRSRMHTWYKPRLESWDEHLKYFGKTQRRKMRRWSEKVEQTPGLEKVVASSVAEVQVMLDALIDLHQRRWNNAGEPGSYADQKFRSFVCESAKDFFLRDRLHLPTLTRDKQIIGAELHLLGGNRRLYCYSSGYDLDAAEIEPGRILNVETLLDLYRRDCQGIDFLRGDEPYKQRMAAQARPVIQLRVAAPGFVSRVRDSAWRAGFEMKQWIRTRSGRTPVAVIDIAGRTSAAKAVV